MENSINKLDFNNFVFEVTRRCNLTCAHCARGEAQNIDLDTHYIDRAIQQMRTVENIHLTGGEPFLVPNTIEHIFNQLQVNKVRCLTFTVITNGTILDKGIAEVFNEIGSYCKKMQKKCNRNYKICADIEVSQTPYHKTVPRDAIKFYRKHCKQSNVNVHLQDPKKYGNDNSVMLYSGRAKELSNSFGTASLCYKADIGQNYVPCKIQLNATGNIGVSEMVEFDIEDLYNMGYVNTKPIIDMIHDWNKLYVLDCNSAWQRETAKQMIESGRLDIVDKMDAVKMRFNISLLEQKLRMKQ